MLKNDQEIILELLIQQETYLAELYQVYSEKFPEQEAFWQSLVKEEKEHANWINGLLKSARKGVVHFDECKIKIHPLNTFIGGIKLSIKKARDTDVAQVNAISYALDMEKSMFERDIFGQFGAVSKKAKSVLGLLQKKTEEHAEKIRIEKENCLG